MRIKDFLYETSSGARLTLAQWMRKYVHEHPQYAHNSILSKKVMDDMMIRLHKISTGEVFEPNFKNIFPDIGVSKIACNGLKIEEQVPCCSES